MTNPLGTSDFFALEAGECLDRLELLVNADTPPPGDEFLRMARVLRGSALMAGQSQIARAAAGLEALARAHRDQQRGWDLDRWLSRGIELDNHVIGVHDDVTFSFHLCRGNQGSRWLVSGSYEPLARRIFGSVRAGRLMLEYDDERSGGFEPLAHVPEDKVAVLGLVSTKTPRRETPAELEARIRQAAAYVPLERLALSPQCGFGTSVVGNALGFEDQEYKLRAVAETAKRVWG